jgi:NACalpha-BTF3-like transcription factor
MNVKRTAKCLRKMEEFEDTKGAIRIHISKKNRQHTGQKKNVQTDKQRSTKHTYKTLLITGGELRWSERESSSCSTIGTRRVNQVTNPVVSHE